MPDKLFRIEEVEMTSYQAEVYKNVAENLAHGIEAQLENPKNKALTVTNILTQLLRLAQITAGFVTWDASIDPETGDITDKQVEGFNDNPKLDRLIELIKEKPQNEKVIIWSVFRPSIFMIMQRLNDEGMPYVTYYGDTSEEDREKAKERFNWDRDLRIMIANPMTAATGLNLLGYPPRHEDEFDTNCTEHIYYSMNWSSILRNQSMDRSHRRGTHVPLTITDLVCPETIDEDIRCAVLEKQMNAMEISDVRQILRNVLETIQ